MLFSLCETNAGLRALLCAFGLTAFQFVRIRLPFPTSFLSSLIFPFFLAPSSLSSVPTIPSVPCFALSLSFVPRLSSAPSNPSCSLLHPDVSYRTSNRSPRRMSLTHRTNERTGVLRVDPPPNSCIDPPASKDKRIRSVDHRIRTLSFSLF